ncbi:hypothetical protein ACO2Q2_08220, partial [Dyella sp. KRB-257]|uniref:hypothetical protein n=1 Tax=Dyella sp. KRB-257 TaxID=3400915 RepID=UPI003C074C28
LVGVVESRVRPAAKTRPTLPRTEVCFAMLPLPSSFSHRGQAAMGEQTVLLFTDKLLLSATLREAASLEPGSLQETRGNSIG